MRKTLLKFLCISDTAQIASLCSTCDQVCGFFFINEDDVSVFIRFCKFKL